MRRTTWVHVSMIGLLAAACGDEAVDPDVVARAGDYDLTVAQVVALLEDQEHLPNEASVVESLVDLWVDYTLLAEAAAEDTTFSDLDLAALVRQRTSQEMIFQLRDSVIQVDTFITADELRSLYAAETPEVQVRARHIMLTYPFDATAAQRDSVRRELGALRERIVAGASFEEMARQYSQDPGSASVGGDVGVFGRGDMVAPFENAVMALDPGEISDVVETPMGLHLIRLEERREQAFEEVANAFRRRVQEERIAAAESTFVAGLEGSGLRVTEGAIDVARELARNPDTRLRGRARRRALVEWDGGSYTAGQLLELLQFEQPSMRFNVAQSSDEVLDGFLRDLARRELLIAEARRSGLEPPRERVDSLVQDVQRQLLNATRTLGLLDLDRAPGERLEPAISRAVRDAIADNLSGATRIVPLGLIGFQLRDRVQVAVYPTAVGQTLIRIAEVRANRSLSPLEESIAAPPAGAAPGDTTGGP